MDELLANVPEHLEDSAVRSEKIAAERPRPAPLAR
jgi:hypothetical protein